MCLCWVKAIYAINRLVSAGMRQCRKQKRKKCFCFNDSFFGKFWISNHFCQSNSIANGNSLAVLCHDNELAAWCVKWMMAFRFMTKTSISRWYRVDTALTLSLIFSRDLEREKKFSAVRRFFFALDAIASCCYCCRCLCCENILCA